MQGPTVPISLFGDAASQGISAGNALPTELTSGIQGAIKGLGQGLDLVAKGQENEIRQNQIEQIPIQNQIQQNQLKNAELITQLRTLQVEQATATQALQLEDEKVSLENDISKKTAEKQLREKTQQFVAEFQAADPSTKVNLVMGGQYQDVFAQLPNIYKQSLQSAFPYMNPQQQQAVSGYIKTSNVKDYYGKLAQQKYPEYLKAKEAFENNDLTQSLLKKMEVTPEEIPSKVDFVPYGKYETNNGKIVINKKSSSQGYQQNPNYDGATAQKGYTVVTKDGTILEDFVSPDTKKAYDNYSVQVMLQNGTIAQRGINNVTGSGRQQNQQGGQEGPPSPNTRTNTSLQDSQNVPEDPYTATVKQSLGVDDKQVKSLEVPLKMLESQISLSVNNPDKVFMLSNIAETSKTIAKSIIFNQFDNSPAIQAQYTQSHVDEYNKGVDAAFGTLYRVTHPETVAAFKMGSPKDLYFAKQYPIVSNQVNKLVGTLTKSYQAQKMQVFNAQVAGKKNVDFLSKVANGAQLPR